MYSKFIDLSHKIEEDMPTFKGIEKPRIYPVLTHEASRQRYSGFAEFELTRVELTTSIGTYIDSPYHRHRDMEDISSIKLEDVILDGVLAKSRGKALFPESLEMEDKNLSGKAVLINTGWSRFWRSEEYFDHPFVTAELAEYFVEQNVRLVGIDTINIDNPEDLSRPAHTILLRNHIYIVENLNNLHLLYGKKFIFFAVPLKIRAAAFPVRAFAEIF
jgi:kynurenine formamidase